MLVTPSLGYNSPASIIWLPVQSKGMWYINVAKFAQPPAKSSQRSKGALHNLKHVSCRDVLWS